MLSVLLDGRHCWPTLTVAKMMTVIDGRQCQSSKTATNNDGRQCRLVCHCHHSNAFSMFLHFVTL